MEYDHQDGADVIGGFVYRGTLLPELYGKYVFADHRGPRDNGAEYPVPNGLGRFFYGDLATGSIYQFNVSGLGSSLPTFIFSIGQDSAGELYVLGAGGVFAVVPVLPGDFNHDNRVDAADYAVWRKTLGDSASYNLWRANFGGSVGGGSGQAAAVPEPAMRTLLITMVAMIGGRRRRSVA
jgi:hypothetical protein